jgi:hypothetical protein
VVIWGGECVNVPIPWDGMLGGEGFYLEFGNSWISWNDGMMGDRGWIDQ